MKRFALFRLIPNLKTFSQWYSDSDSTFSYQDEVTIHPPFPSDSPHTPLAPSSKVLTRKLFRLVYPNNVTLRKNKLSAGIRSFKLVYKREAITP